MTKKKDTRTNSDLQNITHKTKARATRTPLSRISRTSRSKSVNNSFLDLI
jgi:hypothetical protein